MAAYANYFGQATGETPDIHPWYYYLALLAYQHPAAGFTWSEGLIVGLAVVGIAAALAGKGLGQAHLGLVRFLAFYTVLLTVLDMRIPYKTPCASFFPPGHDGDGRRGGGGPGADWCAACCCNWRSRRAWRFWP